MTESKGEVLSLNGKAVIRTREPLMAEFHPTGTLTGFGGINTVDMRDQVHGKRIFPRGNMSSTLVGSAVPEIEEQESQYMNAIGRTRSWFISDEELLHLCGADGNDPATRKRLSR